MISVIAGKKIQQKNELKIDPGFKRIVVDLGCGDGKQTYKLAYESPQDFFIGIDANFKGLEEISRKARRKLAKGGLPNLIYLHGVVEQLPSELESIADEVQINFPWGSLLEGIVLPKDEIINNIKMIAKDGAQLTIFLTYDDKYEETFRTQRNLPELTENYLNNDLKQKYLDYGIKIENVATLSDDEKSSISSPWGKKILDKRSREVFKIHAKIYK